ncbi:hypothetical protein [Adhaeretor mobilis]|uniref:Uncharacterized protein n=1 Tax=Adhaeretor mobilis TaxID=1930276 RepID=A0A517MUV9_9BACT|nr:hypothetical protein [Adhaeretor mobilis]QDS98662.1 hypothetical protein HG15A2_19430 [Adhaeretor mobilis]
MLRSFNNVLLALLAVTALAASGCARHLHTDRCGAILDENLFSIALDSVLIPYVEECGAQPSCELDPTCDLGCHESELEGQVVYCDEAGNCGLQVAEPPQRKRNTPPLVGYVPPQPPKFLPVPTQPAFTDVSSDSPMRLRGSVERNFGPQLTFPGRD